MRHQEYTDGQKLAGLRLYLAHMPIEDIVRHEATGKPGIRTFYRWMERGDLTDGVPWREYREEVDRQAMVKAAQDEVLQTAAEAADEQQFYANALVQLKSIYKRAENYMLQDASRFSASDLETVLRLIATLENQSAEKIKFGKWFILQVLEILFSKEVGLDERQAVLVRTKLAELQERVMNDLKPVEYAIVSRNDKQ